MILEPLLLPYGLPAIEAPAVGAGSWRFHDEAVLGTRLGLIISAEHGEQALVAARAVRAEIDRLNRVFNSRMTGSELVALNGAREWRASDELFEVIAAAERWRVETGGAFSARLGQVIELWRGGGEAREAARLAKAADQARVEMDAASRMIARPEAVRFALDGFAKGWIVDAALKAALRAEGVRAALVDIGGDVACGGEAPEDGWAVGVADPMLPFDNAPLVASVALRGGGIATSGQGPRDRVVDGKRLSPTLSPRTGMPVTGVVSASVTARSAAEADALATAAMVLPVDRAREVMERHGAGARLTAPDGTVATLGVWQGVERPKPVQVRAPGMWPQGWQALATFTAPRRQLIRDPDFRSPYMAMWITDQNNKPVRTLILIGKRAEWQKDNYIWWQQNRDATGRLLATRSMSTSGSGVYNVFWDGVDDAGKPVAATTYVLHVETSRERGKHTYRRLTLDFSDAKRFAQDLAATEEGGGLKVTYDHY